MDNYSAIAVIYEMAKAYAGLLETNGFPADSQEEKALLTISELLKKMENESGS